MLSWLSKLLKVQKEFFCNIRKFNDSYYVQASSLDIDGIWSTEDHTVYVVSSADRESLFRTVIEALGESKLNIPSSTNEEGLKKLLHSMRIKSSRQLMKSARSVAINLDKQGVTVTPKRYNGHYLEPISEKAIVLNNPTEEAFLAAIDQAFEACG